MTVSVLVPTRNRPDDLGTFVRSLVAQTRKPEELVVVDSSDPAVPVEDIVRRGLEGSGIVLLYSRSEPGTSLQRNVAVGMAHGVLFVLFTLVAVMAKIEHDWTLRRLARGWATSLVPFGMLAVDRLSRTDGSTSA